LWASQSGKGWGLGESSLQWQCFEFEVLLFQMTMAINNEQITREKSLVNLVMRLWTKISSFLILKHKLSKFMKLVEIACVQVFGFVEDE